MIIVVPVQDLQPGMYLAQSVINNFNILLSQGYCLTESDIRFLFHQCPDTPILIENDMLAPSVEANHDASKTEPITSEMFQPLRETLETISQNANLLLRQNVALQAEQLRELEEIIAEMLRLIQDNPVTFNVLEQSVFWHKYLQSQGMNVFHFSLLLAYRLQDYARQKAMNKYSRDLDNSVKYFTPLAVAALFHDLGMTPIQYVYDKTDSLEENEIISIKAHPLVSVKLLPDEISSIACHAILHHHENYDGSGYMEGLQKEDISVFGRILRITDAYAAAISKRSYHSSKPPVAALHEMMFGPYRPCYDPSLLRLFADVIMPLPIGAKLKLNSQQEGVVVGLHPANPFNPQIIIAFDQQGKPLPKSKLSQAFYLSEREDIQVISFGNIDLAFLNTPAPEISLDLYHAALDRIVSNIFSLAHVGSS